MTYTPVHNRFWSDGWVRGLNALDRYLFLYLLTNGRAGLTGIYELPLDLMASESGIDEKDLRNSMLNRLEPKIYYKEGWVIIVNYPNHRVSNSPKLLAGIAKSYGEVPKKIQELAVAYGYPIHTISIPIPTSRNRIEENRKEKEIAKPISYPFPLREVREQNDKPERKPANKVALALREWCYGRIEKEYGVRPTNNLGDYVQITKALKHLKESDVKDMMDEALSQEKGKTVRSVFTDRLIDLYRQENI